MLIERARSETESISSGRGLGSIGIERRAQRTYTEQADQQVLVASSPSIEAEASVHSTPFLTPGDYGEAFYPITGPRTGLI